MSKVGNETKANMRGTGLRSGGGGSTVGSSSLGKAAGALKAEHPHQYNALGPHHGTSDHVRHERLGGLRPAGRK